MVAGAAEVWLVAPNDAVADRGKRVSVAVVVRGVAAEDSADAAGYPAPGAVAGAKDDG
ncbi:hypothetical protein DE4587_00039 [Mycobacteroides salmoniphilum]|nr:hypothetical protein DE4586_00123 [Mycobacteroides salmoniphilum]TDZ87693.1 hypothetical protein DE4587_00039 [Mycobacteroides salmoniphilum]